jgi:hypothetical protein
MHYDLSDTEEAWWKSNKVEYLRQLIEQLCAVVRINATKGGYCRKWLYRLFRDECIFCYIMKFTDVYRIIQLPCDR